MNKKEVYTNQNLASAYTIALWNGWNKEAETYLKILKYRGYTVVYDNTHQVYKPQRIKANASK